MIPACCAGSSLWRCECEIEVKSQSAVEECCFCGWWFMNLFCLFSSFSFEKVEDSTAAGEKFY